MERLGILCDIAKGSEITLCHENEKSIYGDSALRCLEILKALPDIKGIFDPANFIQCGQDTLQAWELLKPYIKYLHIKDAKADGSVVPAGCGRGNVRFIVADYIKRGGNTFTVEPHLKAFDGLKTLEKAGDESVVGTGFNYSSNSEAFSAGVAAFKNILEEL